MNIKPIFVVFALLFSGLELAAQNLDVLNGYKVIFLPYQPSNIVNEVENRFQGIGFKVHKTTYELNQDSNYLADPNLVLTCRLEHFYNYPHTTISIQLINSVQNVIFQGKADSRKKTFVSFNLANDQTWVIDKLFSVFEDFDYNFSQEASLTSQYINSLPEVEKTNETEESLKAYYSSKDLNPIEGIYKSMQGANMPYYKIGIKKRDDKFIAIILESGQGAIWKIGEVKAHFELSSLNELYSVKWYTGNKSTVEAFAIIENNAVLSIEFINPTTGEKTYERFIKMFPIVNTEVLPKNMNTASGSGFFISTDGVIATNAHVIDNSDSIIIQISDGTSSNEYYAKVLLVDKKNDVALLKVDDNHFRGFKEIPYSLIEKAEIGEKAFTIGFPLNSIMGVNYKLTDGIISSSSGLDDDIRYYQISVPLQPGNSGGPLFNSSGDVIGITTARLNSASVGTKVENVNYAIKISYLITLYNLLPDAKKLNSTSSLKSKELKEQVKILGKYVCLIKAYKK